MGCLQVIKGGMAAYTDTDRKIALFLLERQPEVLSMSVDELARNTEVSSAAIVRFAKKIGYSGFREMKIALAMEHTKPEYADIHTILKESDSLESMVEMAERINRENLERTYQMIPMRSFSRMVDLADQAKTLYLFGIGASGLVALDLQQKLSRLHRSVSYYQDVHASLSTMALMTPEDAALIISYSGARREVCLAADIVKEKKAPLLAITQMNGNQLMKKADCVLYLPNEEQELRVGAITSRISGLLLTDLIYLAIAQRHMAETERAIQETKDVVSRLWKE